MFTQINYPLYGVITLCTACCAHDTSRNCLLVRNSGDDKANSGFVVSRTFYSLKCTMLDKPGNHLYTCYSSIPRMSLNQEQKLISNGRVAVVAVGALIVVALFSLWAVGYDVGQIFSIVQGKSAYDTMWLHEFVHDIRHESGFPCH